MASIPVVSSFLSLGPARLPAALWIAWAYAHCEHSTRCNDDGRLPAMWDALTELGQAAGMAYHEVGAIIQTTFELRHPQRRVC